jgi:predicted nucleic acid-binding protein
MFCRMTPEELIQFRARMGWDRKELARQLDISVSRIADYEAGKTRGRNGVPAPVPRTVDLACRYLAATLGPLSKAERRAAWRDTSNLPADRPHLPDEAISRESIYEERIQWQLPPSSQLSPLNRAMAMATLVDTNVLLRRLDPDSDQHNAAIDSVDRLLAGDEPTHICPQNIAELWNVMTRPRANNGLGLTVESAAGEVDKLERIFSLLPDRPEIYQTWKHLVRQHRVVGSKVHDARLVAAMQVHGIERLLTFNADDFVRFPIVVVHL